MKAPFVVFYAWQSDRPGGANRYLIQAALEAAAERINDDAKLPYELRIDQDARDEPGLCDIPAAILQKIEACDAMVCDLTYIATTTAAEGVTDFQPRYCGNPNVLFELGYGFRAIGPERIVCVMNEAYGPVAEQIFDLAHRRFPIGYRYPWEGKTKAEVIAILSKELETALRLLFRLGRRADAGGEDRAAARRREFEERVRAGEFHGLTRRAGAIAISAMPMSVCTIGHEILQRQHFPPPQGRGEHGWNTDITGRSVLAVATMGEERCGVAELRSDGTLLGADTWVLDPTYHPKYEPSREDLFVPSSATESTIIWTVTKYLKVLQNIGVPLPWLVGVSLIEIRGYWFLASNSETSRLQSPSPDIIADPIVVNTYDEVDEVRKVGRILRPVFDFLWREFGFRGCRHYTGTGDWKEP